MLRSAILLAPLLPLLAGCAGGSAEDAGCVMREVARMPVLNAHGVPVVTVGLDGSPAAFVVDTGANVSTVSPTAAERYGIPVDWQRSVALNGVGGVTQAHPVRIDRLDLGTAAARRIELVEADDLGDWEVDGLPVAGLFGTDFLAGYDVDFDLPARRVSLYSEHACPARFGPPYDGTVYREEFDLTRSNGIVLPATLDGVRTRVQLDSGASATIVGLGVAHDAGASPRVLAGDRTVTSTGIDGNRLRTAIHQFDTLEIGPDRWRNPTVGVADIQSMNLLGADFLRSHRVWVSYRHHLLWVQPTGRVRLLSADP